MTNPVPNNCWDGVYKMAKDAGAKWGELVAAQWALESGWGKKPHGNNYFGLTLTTNPVTYVKFNSLQAGVVYLVDRWYKNYKGYFGVNRATTREEAARLLVKEGYNTENPKYADKLIQLMNDYAPISTKDQIKDKVVSVYKTTVRALNLSQPDAVTCQSACISMATGEKDVYAIRRQLEAIGNPGDPYVMGKVIRKYKGGSYSFVEDASLNEIKEWLKDGEFLITHGWFTNSGHVICLDGVSIDEKTLSYKLDVKDPWSEFDAPSWSYRSSANFYDGYYSSYCIYASCVAGSSKNHAASLYKKGVLDSSQKGAWVHRIKS
jgi:hypothetical protein